MSINPSTKEEIYTYITLMLNDTKSSYIKNINNELWHIKFRLIKNAHTYMLAKNIITNEYGYYISNNEGNYEKDLLDLPMFERYKNYDEMLIGVINEYMKVWQIKE